MIMTKTADNQAALLAFLAHTAESACKEQIAFCELAKDVANLENAIGWRAKGALHALYTERHANAVLTMLSRGDVGLRPIYDSLIDRLTVLASSDNNPDEMRALAVFLRSLKDWL